MGWLAPILSGVLSGFSHLTVFDGWRLPDMGFLGFFAWVPLFYVLRNASPRRAFLLSAAACFIQYSISMYWIYTAMNTFGHLSAALSVLALALLVLVLSIYFGIIFYLSQYISLKTGLAIGWIRPWVWVGIEFLRGHIPTGGFPWGQLGYTQGGFLPFIQISDLFGVYVVTFVLVMVNEALTSLLCQWRRQEAASRVRPLVLTAAILFAATLGYGVWRMNQPAPPAVETLRVGVVQGNIPQDEKWLAGAARKILTTFQEGTKQVEAQGAQLVLWPEAAYPGALPIDAPQFNISFGLEKADLLFGAVTRPRDGRAAQEMYYNTALLVDAQGTVQDFYHKRHLVPFGEYVPWKDYLFFAKKMTSQVGNVVPGEVYRPMNYRGRGLGVLICYEDIFPEIARIMTEQGAQVLINLTNDAWYGYSSAAYQHQVFSQFRSVETRRALVRATNTGLSSLIDRWGRVLWEGKLYEREDFNTELPFYTDRTVYTRVGDIFPIVGLGVTGVGVLVARFRKKTLP